MDTPSEDGEPLPPQLMFLKRLVTGLAVVMIAGFLVLIVALVIRLNRPLITLPEQIALPAGAEAQAFTQGADWFAVVTTDDRILIFDRASGALRQTVTVD
ncbi:DUF6476 family protein [Marivivens marinus]|uniref:DUF6476 family protein n=1 Tax=Marivivens marinus TaxID=3110173 RepID=UPI003B845647